MTKPSGESGTPDSPLLFCSQGLPQKRSFGVRKDQQMPLSGLKREIDTPRLRLRAPTDTDAVTIAALCADADIPRLAPLGDLEEAKSFIAHDSANTFLIERPGHGPIGC